MAETGVLSAKQERFVEALLAGANLTVAAVTVKIGYRTAQRWKTLPEVQVAYRAAKQRMFEEALDDLKAGLRDVVKALKQHIDANVEPTAATQVRAIQIWIETQKMSLLVADTDDPPMEGLVVDLSKFSLRKRQQLRQLLAEVEQESESIG